MRIRVTQYGFPKDPDGNTLTSQDWGNVGNKLTINGCALTDQAKNLLGVKEMDWIFLYFENGIAMCRQFQDRAPEDEPRIYLYVPHGWDAYLPDFAEVSTKPICQSSSTVEHAS